MKKLLCLLAVTWAFGALAQVVSVDEWEVMPSYIPTNIDVFPTWPGCESLSDSDSIESCFTESLKAFLLHEFQLPATTRNLGIHGKVWVGFIIEEDGTLGPVTLLKSLESYVDNEVIRVVQQLPPMARPGYFKDKPVTVRFSVPINVQLNTPIAADAQP